MHHNESRRGGGPFVPVNCAVLPEGILESELFGHVKGAFPGTVRDKKGRFELAHEGTLFMDEVTDLSRVVQAKLLRVLQEKRFEPVGSEKTTIVDVRLICATNRDLKQEMERGNFREDHHENWVRKASEPPSPRAGGIRQKPPGSWVFDVRHFTDSCQTSRIYHDVITSPIERTPFYNCPFTSQSNFPNPDEKNVSIIP